MFRVKPRATLDLIFFTVLIQNSEKQWKVLSGCLKNLPSGIPQGKFFQTTTADFPLFIPDFDVVEDGLGSRYTPTSICLFVYTQMTRSIVEGEKVLEYCGERSLGELLRPQQCLVPLPQYPLRRDREARLYTVARGWMLQDCFQTPAAPVLHRGRGPGQAQLQPAMPSLQGSHVTGLGQAWPCLCHQPQFPDYSQGPVCICKHKPKPDFISWSFSRICRLFKTKTIEIFFFFLNKLPYRGFFKVIMAKHGFYNGRKVNYFEIPFLARKNLPILDQNIPKDAEQQHLGVCFLIKVDFVNIFMRKSGFYIFEIIMELHYNLKNLKY